MNYEGGIWVFGYGSLMWNPGFKFESVHRATLRGYIRSFCLWSVHYRGTEAAPGLVLGLDRQKDALCEGVAYFVPAALAEKAHQYLRERELVSYAYLEKIERLALKDGRTVPAICYVVDKTHAQYADNIAITEKARVISTARGSAGDNLEYLESTSAHLQALGIVDQECERLMGLVSGLAR